MNKNKKLLIIPLMAISTAVLAGCGNPRNSYAYDLDFNVNVEGTTIKMWAGFGSAINDVLDDLLDEFERLTKVKVEYESKSSYDDTLKAVTLAATSGNYPHVVVGYPDHFATYVKSDIIVRLDYYLENDVHNPTFEPTGETFKLSDFYNDYIVENQSIEYRNDGTPYTLGIPFNKSTEVLVYNKNFFTFAANNEQLKDKIFVPRTYDELETVGLNILEYFESLSLYGKVLYDDGTTVQKSNSKIVLDLSEVQSPNSPDLTRRFKPFSYDSQANLFITTVRQNGGVYTMFDKVTRRGYLAFDSAETRTGLNRLKYLYDEKVFGIPADWGESKYGSNPFKASKTVMTLGSSAGVANDTTAGNKFQIGAAPVPYAHADKKYVISQGANLALLDTGSRQQRVAAWQLIKFLSKYANGYFCSQTGYYPTCAYAEQAGEDGVAGMWANYHDEFDGTDYATWLDEARNSLSDTDIIRAETAEINLDYYIDEAENWIKFIDPPFAGSANVREAVASITPWIFTGERTVDNAIREIYSVLSDYVREN
jgi:multiple sugar transport system substrate-binding protein